MAAHRYLLAATLFISAVGDTEIETLRLARATGTSVIFPGLKNGTEFKENMFYELTKVNANPGWLMMYHGDPKVQKSYETRGVVLSENKSFLLTNLTKKDSGVYEQKLNQRTLLRVVLTMIDPVKEPVLRRQDGDNKTCRITLQCAGSERDSSNMTFFRNGVEITRNTSSHDNLLVIDGTDPHQWGNYTCVVTNLVSRSVSLELEFIPEERAADSLFFYISCIGGVIYMCHLLCLLFNIRDNNTPFLQNVLFYSKCLCGVITEIIVSSIVIDSFTDLGDQSSNVNKGITVSVVSVILLVRVLWSLMFCGVPLQTMVITVMEDVLLAADALLVPAVIIGYIYIYYQASDLCGMKRDRRLRMFFFLLIGFIVLLLVVVLPLRILWMKCRASGTQDPPGPHKGSFVLPTDDVTEDESKNDQGEAEALTEEETPT